MYLKMNEENLNNLQKNIIKIFNKETNIELNLNDVSIKKIVHKYSNTNIPIYRLFDKDICLTKNNKFCVIYKCLVCNRENITALNNITRKINENQTNCQHCKELEEEKRNNHSLVLRNMIQSKKSKKEATSKSLSLLTILEKLNCDSENFYKMDDDFQENYYKKHLTVEEFERIRNKIISIQSDRIMMSSDYIYYPTVKIANQTMFNPYLYNKNNDVIEKIQYVKFKCENCKDTFINRDLFIQKNKYKIFCQECNFTNNVFKLRHFKNCKNENILYQSKFELKFIKFCNENKIVIKNGPNIPYEWNNTSRKYKIDFLIPDIKLLVEIKDNHVWHKEQINNDKWNCKLKGVEKYLNINKDYKYEIAYPKNYIELTKKIQKDVIKYSLNYERNP